MRSRLLLWSGVGTVGALGAMGGAWILSLPPASALTAPPPMEMASDEGWGGNGFGFFFQQQRDPYVQPANPRRRGQNQYYQPAQPVPRSFW